MPRPALNAVRNTASAPALTRWPAAPRGFSAPEREVWRRLGRAAMVAGGLTEADLPLVEAYCRFRARADALYADPAAKFSTISAGERICKEILVQLGLTPASRKSVQAPSAPTKDSSLAELVKD